MAHNFFIGDLGFHKVINDEHPYERATAPFRKEQFDSAPTVGDQSLSGWWTRGQLSFHNGAGTKYYEVLEGEEILNTYHESLGVDPATPGELSLQPPTADLALADVVDCVTVFDSTGNEHLVANTWDGVSARNLVHVTPDLYDFAASTTTSLATPGAAGLTASRDKAFWAVGSTIYEWEPGGTATSLWTMPVSVAAMHYGKGRLWVIDSSDNLYMLSLSGGTVPSGDEFGKILDVSSTWTYTDYHMTEVPTGLLVANREQIWHVTLDESETVPAPAPPVSVAKLPNRETILGLGHELGHVVIATDQGVRFGSMETGGRFTYGPLVGPRGRMHGVRVASFGAQVLTASARSVVAFDFTHSDQPFQPAWHEVASLTNNLNTGRGVLAVRDDTWPGVVSWDAGGTMHFSTKGGTTGGYRTPTGELTTGYHRFGTLDKKHFKFVVVRYEGHAGTIEVSRVDDSGTVTSLETIVVDGPGFRQIDLGVADPVESIALRFDLEASSGGSFSPVLLGYQLKALPAPKRQRLIRVPLMMFDTERGPTGRAIGAEKSAWTRYTTLEDLEEADALVTYEDKDTGEMGTAFIESVELIQRNGPKGVSRSNGFGGIVSVTLRKVS